AKAPNEGDVVKKYLRMIQQEAFRCKAITQRLLEFSRSAERRREATDLGELIQSVLDVVQHLQNSKGKQIVLEQAAPVVAWISAGLNQGSTFTVRLPLHAAEEQGLGVRGQGLEVRDQGREGQGLEPDKGTEPRSKRMAA